MTDRTWWYTTTILRGFDLAWATRDTMSAIAFLGQDTNGGTTTVIGGLAGSATAPTSLNITLAAGRIYQQAAVDATAYSVLASDSDLIMQQGMASAQSVLLSTSGLSSGQSRWALIQATFSQVDQVRPGDPTAGVESYFNTANPSQPFLGPNNSGAVQPTVRLGVCSISVIYGAPASTGAEVPPTPSNGNVPLYLIDLAFGQTAVAQNQIIAAGPSVGVNVPNNYPTAPFLAGLLNSHHSGTTGQAPKIKMGEIAAVSSANAGAGLPALYAYAGNPNGHVAGVAAVAGVSPADFCIDVTNNLLYFCSTTGNAASAVWNPTTGQQINFSGGTSTGTANAQAVNPLTPGGFSLTSGYSVTFTPGVTNTGATTFAGGGTAATACRKVSGGSLVAFTGGEFTINVPVTVVYNGTFWVLQTSPLGAVAPLNIGAFLKNDGLGNLAVANGAGLGDDGTGKLGVLATAVTPGTYTNPKITVGADGRLTAAANGAAMIRTVLTATSGTYTPGAGAKRLHILMCGGGGGAGNSGSATPQSGQAGGTTTWGAGPTTALGGSPGVGSSLSVGPAGGTGGADGGVSGVYRTPGQAGGPVNTVAIQMPGPGGASLLGVGTQISGFVNSAGADAAAPGDGGAGASFNGANIFGTGGGAGETADFWIVGSLAGSYSYGVGPGGAGALAGTGGSRGGNGFRGVIIVEEFYY